VTFARERIARALRAQFVDVDWIAHIATRPRVTTKTLCGVRTNV
jgi:hypothetical protein